MKIKKPVGERSFTLVETVIAVALMTTILLEAVSTMGNIVYFSSYSRILQVRWKKVIFHINQPTCSG